MRSLYCMDPSSVQWFWHKYKNTQIQIQIQIQSKNCKKNWSTIVLQCNGITIIGTINISSPWSISYHSMINISSPWSIAYHSMINRFHPRSTAASLHDQQISSMINSLSLDDQHISYMINSWSCMMYYKIMSLWKLSWSLAGIFILYTLGTPPSKSDKTPLGP